nr:PREDICTED: adenosine deaminase domain-containing protein 2-like isoform X2 [Latimeria chalumnae]|eukprot:XP_014348681.1 PREDICTED: adenosine deaminase domain-containing protein 2-like isoform X2 [Latimeria chalumnae]
MAANSAMAEEASYRGCRYLPQLAASLSFYGPSSKPQRAAGLSDQSLSPDPRAGVKSVPTESCAEDLELALGAEALDEATRGGTERGEEPLSAGPVTMFSLNAVIDGKMYPRGIGTNRREAKGNAAAIALLELSKLVQRPKGKVPRYISMKGYQTSENLITHEHRCAAICSDMFDRLLQDLSDYSSCKSSIAAFIMERDAEDDGDQYELVALGTGNSCYAGWLAFDGRLLHDCHALVVVRRTLQRFLYKQLLLFHSNDPLVVEKSIFCSSPGGSMLSLRPGIFFHLYLGKVPEGAARTTFINPPGSELPSLSMYMHMKGALIRSIYCEPNVHTTHVCCMSESDKMTRWIVLGVQGALLSHFIQPIYITSVVLGDHFYDRNTVSQVINKRLEGALIRKLPDSYERREIHFFWGEKVGPVECEDQCKTSSLNWAKGDAELEIVDGATGKITEDSPFQSGHSRASRLCKAAMLSSFRKVAEKTGRSDLLIEENYHSVKLRAETYQKVKKQVNCQLFLNNVGQWNRKELVGTFNK